MTVDALVGPEGARAAGAVLGPAFVEDPLWTWMLRGGSRERRLTAAFTAFAARASRTPGSQLLVTAERTAAAVWLPPGAWRAPLREQVRTAPGLAGALRPGGTFRALRMQAVVERLHPREPHWYLEALGAVPRARGTVRCVATRAESGAGVDHPSAHYAGDRSHQALRGVRLLG